jgi:quercetin dioxygenase-like cupin family protein
MGKVVFTGSDDNVVGGDYSGGTGPVLRSDTMEVARVFFTKGKGAEPHRHPEEQLFFVIEGRLQMTLGEGQDMETYIVGPGEGSFHPSNVLHQDLALEDTIVVSFKALTDPTKSADAVRNVYAETGRLDRKSVPRR